jgi:hypothetical protein
VGPQPQGHLSPQLGEHRGDDARRDFEVIPDFTQRPQARSGTNTKQPSEKRDTQRQPSPTPVGPRPEVQMGSGTKIDAGS